MLVFPRPRCVQRRPRYGLVLAVLFLAAGAAGRAFPEKVSRAGSDAASVWPGEGSPIEQAEWVRTLGGESDQQLRLLLRLADHPEPLVRGTAVQRLLELPADRVGGELRRLPVPPEEGPALVFLELEMADPAGFFTASNCRRAEALADPWMRSRAAMRCIDSREELDAGQMERLIADPHWAVRTRVATALGGRVERGTAGPWLERLAGDPHLTVRRAAERALSASRPGS